MNDNNNNNSSNLVDSPLSSVVVPASVRRRTRSSKSSTNSNCAPLSQKCCLSVVAVVLISSLIVTIYMTHTASSNKSNNELYLYIPTSLRKGQPLVTTNSKTKSESKSTTADEPQLHLVFSTDCSSYQHWQSYVLYYSAVQVGQKGTITRIISGCDDTQMQDMIAWHEQNVLPLTREPKKFTLHFTPNYDHPILESYVFVNKPFGLLHYFEHYNPDSNEHGFSMEARSIQTSPNPSLQLPPDDIIAVIDPDMMFLKPLTHDFTPSSSFQPVYAPGNEPNTDTQDPIITVVQHGHPFSARYSVGDPWRAFNLPYITGSNTTPALNFTSEQAMAHFQVGSPYIATMKDMYAITPTWLVAVHKVREEYQEHISEMYSYIIGAAHANLPHVVLQGFIISGDDSGEEIPTEGWSFLPEVPPSQVCTFGEEAYKLNATDICNQDETSWKCQALKKLPNFLHFCQGYNVGNWFWGKHNFPKDYFTCESPLMATPPSNLGSDYANYRLEPGQSRSDQIPINSFEKTRNAFVICAMSKVLQEAAEYYKSHSCTFQKTNLDKTLNLYELLTPLEEPQEEEQQPHEEEQQPQELPQRNVIQNPNLHLVFHTDCSMNQNWKSYALFVSATLVKQPGKITRIVSGCKQEEQMDDMIQWHVTHILPLTEDPKKFTLHFTPNYDHKTFLRYKFVNKPYGLLHFLEHYDDNDEENNEKNTCGCVSSKARKVQRAVNPSLDSENNPISSDERLEIDPNNGGRNTGKEVTPSLIHNPDDIIIVLEADMIFLRSITNDFTSTLVYEPKFVDGSNMDEDGNGASVQHGRPFAAKYNVEAIWKEFNLPYVTGSETTPASEISNEDVAVHYSIGPPYVASMADMYELTPVWLKAVQTAPDEYKEYMDNLPDQSHQQQYQKYNGELYSYIIGAAHTKLPHLTLENLIPTDWTFLENAPLEDICSFATSIPALSSEEVCGTEESASDNWKCQVLRKMPNILSLSHRASASEWWFHPEYFPTDFFSCESPSISAPSLNEISSLSTVEMKTNVFFICALTEVLQKALQAYKSKHCEIQSSEKNKIFTLMELSKEPKQSQKERHPYLTEEQLETVQDAQMQSIAYEDFSGANEKDHPHKGAIDEDGNLGYVHDTTALRMNPPLFEVPEESSVCLDDSEMKVMHKVNVDVAAHHERGNPPHPRILCTAYTIESHHDKVTALRETWAPKCDGFMAPSTLTNISLGTVNILHLGKEDYWNIWQKVRSIWAYIYDNYYNEYDWFHLAGEDQYVIVENLRSYLESDTIRSAVNGGGEPLTDWTQEMQTPIYLGRRMAEHGRLSLLYNHGGPGYTLNKAALKTLVSLFPVCDPTLAHAWEDVLIGFCLQKKNIRAFDTRDFSGAHRYHPLGFGHNYEYRPPNKGEVDWYHLYTIDEPLKVGLDAVSNQSIAFHYIDSNLARRMHAYFYHGYCLQPQ